MTQLIGTISGTGRGDGFCVGDGHDETAGLNAFAEAVMAASAEGQNVVAVYEAPPKKYCFSSPLTPIILPTIASNYGMGHISIRGDCPSASILEYTGGSLSALTPLWWFDGDVDSDVIDGGFIKDFTVRCAAKSGTDTPPRLSNVISIKISNRANIELAHLHGIGGCFGIELDGVLSGTAAQLMGMQNLRNGIWQHNTSGELSSCNALDLNSPICGQNWQGGILAEDGQLIISGAPNISGNGRYPSDGKDTGYGVKLLRDSRQNGGAVVGASIGGGGYIEGNWGRAAIWIQHTEASNLVFNINSASIHRLGGGAACINDILVECNSIGLTGLNVIGTGHQDYPGYAPNPANKYLAMTGTGIHRALRWKPGFCNQPEEVPNDISVGRNNPAVQWAYFDVEPAFWGE